MLHERGSAFDPGVPQTSEVSTFCPRSAGLHLLCQKRTQSPQEQRRRLEECTAQPLGCREQQGWAPCTDSPLPLGTTGLLLLASSSERAPLPLSARIK